VFYGYTADGDSDGGQGLATALSQAYDLILLDVMLPTLDGFSICEQLRAGKGDRLLFEFFLSFPFAWGYKRRPDTLKSSFSELCA
jgi:CheY-like chemotaxis protein